MTCGRAAASNSARSASSSARASASSRTVSSRGTRWIAPLQIADGPHAQPRPLGQRLLGEGRRGAVVPHQFADAGRIAALHTRLHRTTTRRQKADGASRAS